MIYNFLCTHLTIKKIDLSYNLFSDTGIVALAHAFKATPITWLNLSGISIKESSMQAVADMLKGHATIEHLDLSHTADHSNTLVILLNTLKFNTSMSELYVYGTPFGEQELQVLCEMLRHNQQLVELGFISSSLSLQCNCVTATPIFATSTTSTSFGGFTTSTPAATSTSTQPVSLFGDPSLLKVKNGKLLKAIIKKQLQQNQINKAIQPLVQVT